MTDWQNQKVIVTGGGGFLGRRVVAELTERGCSEIFVPRSADYDLRDASVVRKMLQEFPPDQIVHLAANVGGIGANMEHPGEYFFDNASMGIHIIEEARKADVPKTVVVGTICSYPKFATVPFKEDELWAGYPEETNAPYGLAKKMLLVQAQAYRQQYGMNVVYLMPVNLYGPGDNFDPESSHVIPALIRKFIEARDQKQPSVEIWGSGTPTREFLYVDDAAKAYASFEKKGGTIIQMSETARASWANNMPNIGKDWASKLDKKGLPGTKLLRAYMKKMRAADQPILRQWDKE